MIEIDKNTLSVRILTKLFVDFDFVVNSVFVFKGALIRSKTVKIVSLALGQGCGPSSRYWYDNDGPNDKAKHNFGSVNRLYAYKILTLNFSLEKMDT